MKKRLSFALAMAVAATALVGANSASAATVFGSGCTANQITDGPIWRLTDAVTTDWQQFTALAAGGLDEQRQALKLVRERPFTGLDDADWIDLGGPASHNPDDPSSDPGRHVVPLLARRAEATARMAARPSALSPGSATFRLLLVELLVDLVGCGLERVGCRRLAGDRLLHLR